MAVDRSPAQLGRGSGFAAAAAGTVATVASHGRTRWLIDGNNVMGARPDGWWRDRAGAAARLADEVSAWQERTGNDVVLVFDGPDRRGLSRQSRPGFEVRFAERSGRNAADDVIARLAEEAISTPQGADERVTVVTSDAGLVARLPARVEVVGAGAFRRMLEQD
jgi:predicted RNA-binding protein with PIN domain